MFKYHKRPIFDLLIDVMFGIILGSMIPGSSLLLISTIIILLFTIAYTNTQMYAEYNMKDEK